MNYTLKIMQAIALFTLIFVSGCERGHSLTPVETQDGYSFTLQIDEPLLRERLKDENTDRSDMVIGAMLDDVARTANDRALDVIRTRFSLADIRCVVTKDSVENRIHVQLPKAAADVASYAEMLSLQNGHLEFRLVQQSNRELAAQALMAEEAPPGYISRQMTGENYFGRATDYAAISSETGYAARLARFGVPQDDASTIMLMQKMRIQDSMEDFYRPIYVSHRPVAGLSGENLRKVEVPTDMMYGYPQIVIQFDSDGSKVFERVTTQNTERQLAIVVDGIVFSAPKIYEPISGGKAVISGSGLTLEETKMFSIVLRSGSLTAPFKIVDRQRQP